MNTRPNTAYHLGNNRVDLAADGGICQSMDYYPFGLPMATSYPPDK